MEREQFEKLKQVILNHDIIAIPTETVFGLAIAYDDEVAFQKLVEVKMRAPNKPFTLMLGDVNDIEKYAYINDVAKCLIDNFLPGEITLLLRVKEGLPWHVTLGTNKIGIRVSGDDTLRKFIHYVGKPLLVPSANKKDVPPALTEGQVRTYFSEEEVKLIAHGKVQSTMPTTIVDAGEKNIKIIRLGSVKETEIEEVLRKNGL